MNVTKSSASVFFQATNEHGQRGNFSSFVGALSHRIGKMVY